MLILPWQGPYAPAIFRFRVFFPSAYPCSPPIITFTADIFHPLLTPLTTYTYTGPPNAEADATDVDLSLPPGALSLRHGFPAWYGKTLSASNDVQHETSSDDSIDDVTVAEVLRYVRTCFEDESVLDSIPFDAVVNQGAWYAWRAHRNKAAKSRNSGATGAESKTSTTSTNRLSGSHSSPNSADARPKAPGDWNWEGVWEERVKRAVQNSLAEPTLYGNAVAKDDDIHFLEEDEEGLKSIKAALAKLSVPTPSS